VTKCEVRQHLRPARGSLVGRDQARHRRHGRGPKGRGVSRATARFGNGGLGARRCGGLQAAGVGTTEGSDPRFWRAARRRMEGLQGRDHGYARRQGGTIFVTAGPGKIQTGHSTHEAKMKRIGKTTAIVCKPSGHSTKRIDRTSPGCARTPGRTSSRRSPHHFSRTGKKGYRVAEGRLVKPLWAGHRGHTLINVMSSPPSPNQGKIEQI